MWVAMKDGAREDRLAKALRDNLARRKAQARETAVTPPAPAIKGPLHLPLAQKDTEPT